MNFILLNCKIHSFIYKPLCDIVNFPTHAKFGIKNCHPKTFVNIVKAIITTQESGEIYNAEYRKGNLIKIENVEMNTVVFEIINVEKYAIKHSVIKCDLCEYFFKTKKYHRAHLRTYHNNN